MDWFLPKHILVPILFKQSRSYLEFVIQIPSSHFSFAQTTDSNLGLKQTKHPLKASFCQVISSACAYVCVLSVKYRVHNSALSSGITQTLIIRLVHTLTVTCTPNMGWLEVCSCIHPEALAHLLLHEMRTHAHTGGYLAPTCYWQLFLQNHLQFFIFINWPNIVRISKTVSHFHLVWFDSIFFSGFSEWGCFFYTGCV